MEHSEIAPYLSEVALLCGDSKFQDFPKGIYETRLLKAFGKVAKKYRILERFTELEITNTAEGAEQVFIDGFSEEFRVVLRRKKPYETDTENLILPESAGKSPEFYEYKLDKTEAQDSLSDGQYSVKALEGEIYFDYKPRSTGDVVVIWYIATASEEDIQDGSIPVIPQNYREEIIEQAVVEMAKLGFANYASDDKKSVKYDRLLKLYAKDPREIDKNDMRHRAPINLNIFQPF